MDVELFNITKRFGNVTANSNVSLRFHSGEVIALLGENGAGKSTLMKMLFGLYLPDEGSVLINNREMVIDSPNKAMSLGIGMVFQQFNLIPALSVLDNLLLTYPKSPFWTFRKFFKKNGYHHDVLNYLNDLAPDLDPATLVRDLSVGQRQLVELVKVLNLNAQVLILDEPTSVLPPQEAERLWGLIRKLASEGKSVVLITHKMQDVMACATKVVVMRAGEMIKTIERSDCTEELLVKLMMGDSAHRKPIQKNNNQFSLDTSPKVVIKKLNVKSGVQSLSNINLEIGKGEVLGLAGVSGNGQQLLADSLVGLAKLSSGKVLIDGQVLQSADQKPKISKRVAYIPEQPAVNAVAGDLSLTINVALSNFSQLNFFPTWKAEEERTNNIIQEYNVRPHDSNLAAGKLSGGNLQKLVVGRELYDEKDLVIAAYPTMGLDVGATLDIYRALFSKAAAGASVLWISEDLDDLMAYANRIAVIQNGRITGIFNPSECTKIEIGHAMTGENILTPIVSTHAKTDGDEV